MYLSKIHTGTKRTLTMLPSKRKSPTKKYKLSKSLKRRDLRKLCFCEQRKRVIRRE